MAADDAIIAAWHDLADSCQKLNRTVEEVSFRRDALWAHPDLIPSADDLEDPAAFVAREELGDPIAELEKAMKAEEQAEKNPDDKADGEEPGAAPTS